MVRDELKQADCARIAELVLAYRPVVIGVGIAALQLEARDLLSDLFDIVSELYRAEKIDRPIDVHAVDGMPARLWAASALARAAFPDHHEMMRQSIAVGRRLLDPLCEFAALFADTERPLQYLQWHPLQSELPRDVLLATLESELVDAVCKVGVDVHRAILHPHARPLLSFVAGIGERKSAALVRAAQRLGGRIVSRVAATGKRGGGGKARGSHRGRRGRDKADDDERLGRRATTAADDDADGGRADLESLCRLIGGATVWRNCVAFLRISKRYISSDALDVRDSTRVHPDDYPMLVKMALDMFGGDADGGGGGGGPEAAATGPADLAVPQAARRAGALRRV
jgi:transcriptional accessory protein Tex/SPT6